MWEGGRGGWVIHPLTPFVCASLSSFLTPLAYLTPPPCIRRPSQMDDLDIHEMHLTDPTDPDSWSNLRGPACLCNFPPCKVGAA